MLTQPFADPSLVFRVLSFPLLLQEWQAAYLLETQLLVDEEDQDRQENDKDPGCRQEANGFRGDWKGTQRKKYHHNESDPTFSSNTWSGLLGIFMLIHENGKRPTSPDLLTPPGLCAGEGPPAGPFRGAAASQRRPPCLRTRAFFYLDYNSSHACPQPNSQLREAQLEERNPSNVLSWEWLASVINASLLITQLPNALK